MDVKVVAACTNANGESDFAFVLVEVETEEDIDLGLHFAAAEQWLYDNDYEYPFVYFDSYDGFDWLMRRFVWESASIIKIVTDDGEVATYREVSDAS